MKYIKIILPLIILALVGSVIYFIPQLLIVRSLECRSQFGPCQEELQVQLDSFRGLSLKRIKLKIKDYFLSDKTIKDYSFQFKFPDRLLVNIIETKAKYGVTDGSKTTFSLIDERGNVTGIKAATNLPFIISPDKPPNIGENVGSNKLFALEIMYNLYSLYQIKEGKIDNSSLTVTFPDGISALFPLEGDRDVLLGSLELILFRLKSEPKDSRIENVTKIDLRFKNPVLQ